MQTLKSKNNESCFPPRGGVASSPETISGVVDKKLNVQIICAEEES